MPRPRLPDTPNHCRACGREMARKMFRSTLEDRTAFRRRKYCDLKCMAAGMTGVIKKMSAQASRRQSTRKMKAACEHCGTTSRLHVHHINSDPTDNTPSNLATLCARCHMKEHWRVWKETTHRPRPCSHCEKPARHRGLCDTHYTRFRRYGDPRLSRTRKGNIWGAPQLVE